MKNLREFFKSKKGKITCVVLLLLVMLIVVGVICVNKNKYKNNNEVETGNGQDNVPNQNQNIVVKDGYKKLSSKLYSIDKGNNTISFQTSDVSMFCLSDSSTGPSISDKWIDLEDKDEISLQEEQLNKKYVYYLASNIKNTTNWTDDADILVIKEADDIGRFSELVNSGTTFEGKTVIMVKNLSLSGVSNFEPIGTETNPFKGTFNGNGYTISGIDISSTGSNVGIFGYVTDATIKNLITQGTKIEGVSYVGGIVGNGTGTIENCINNVPIIGTEAEGKWIGGIAGQFSGSVSYCQNNAEISGVQTIGGIIGKSVESTKIYNCKNTAVVNGSYATAAGIIAGTSTAGFLEVDYCTNEGNITSGGWYSAGILAYSVYATPTTTYNCHIKNCKNTGVISASGRMRRNRWRN